MFTPPSSTYVGSGDTQVFILYTPSTEDAIMKIVDIFKDRIRFRLHLRVLGDHRDQRFFGHDEEDKVFLDVRTYSVTYLVKRDLTVSTVDSIGSSLSKAIEGVLKTTHMLDRLDSFQRYSCKR